MTGRLNRPKEAILVYERATQGFIREKLFGQGNVLKKIFSRMGPSRDKGEQEMILNRLYEQMLESRPEPQERKVELLPESRSSSQSEPIEISQKQGSLMRLEPIPMN